MTFVQLQSVCLRQDLSLVYLQMIVNMMQSVTRQMILSRIVLWHRRQEENQWLCSRTMVYYHLTRANSNQSVLLDRQQIPKSFWKVTITVPLQSTSQILRVFVRQWDRMCVFIIRKAVTCTRIVYRNLLCRTIVSVKLRQLQDIVMLLFFAWVLIRQSKVKKEIQVTALQPVIRTACSFRNLSRSF